MLDAQNGVLYHDGEGQYTCILSHKAQENDTLTLQYNGSDHTLAIGYNDEVKIDFFACCTQVYSN